MIDSLDDSIHQSEEGDSRLLAHQWDDALGDLCRGGLWFVEAQESMMRRMLRHEPIAFTYRIFCNLIVEGEHAVTGRVEKPGPNASAKDRKKYKRSEEALNFTKAWVDRLDYSLKALSYDLCEAFAFGHKLAEAEYLPLSVDQDGFRGGSYVAPADLSPKPRTAYRFRVDKANRVLGVKPEKGTEPQDVPAANLLWVSSGGMDRDPRGLGILPTLWTTYVDSLEARKDQRAASRQSGGGFLVAQQQYPPEGVPLATTIDVPNPAYTEGGTEPKTKAKSTGRIVAEEVRKVKVGGVAAMPPGYTLAMLQGDGATIFDSQLDRADRAVVRAFLGSARSLLEAQNGSKADTGEAADVGLTTRDAARGKICEAIERMFAVVLSINHGDKYRDVCPRCDITTSEGTDLGAVSAFLQANFDKLTTDQKNWLASKVDMPAFPDDDGTDAANAQDQAQTEADIAAAEAADQAANGGNFKSRVEIANDAAQKRVNVAVRSANRQFASLVKRVRNGKIDGQDFVERFAHTLSVGHDRAYSIGYAHAGGDAIPQDGRTYVEETVASEADFARGLMDALTAEEPISEAEGLRRAKMYANRVRGTANEAFRQGSEYTGFTLDWDLGANERHCRTCPQYASESPWEPAEMFAVPGGPDTDCGSACLCKLSRSDGKTGFGPVDFG